MRVIDDANAIYVIITPNTVQVSARSADRFQVIVLPLYSMIGFVRASATSAGIVNARVPRMARPKREVCQARTPAPSIRKPRMTIRNSDRCQEGAVKIYGRAGRVSHHCPGPFKKTLRKSSHDGREVKRFGCWYRLSDGSKTGR